jgi:hypothetical protein
MLLLPNIRIYGSFITLNVRGHKNTERSRA